MEKNQTDSGKSVPTTEQSTEKRVAKNIGIMYFKMAITIYISFYVTSLVEESTGNEYFGIHNLISRVVAMLVFLNAVLGDK